MRRRLAGLLCGVLLATAAAACGIPKSSEVQVDGRGLPPTEAGSTNGRPNQPPIRTTSGNDTKAFVLNFLAAAAGEPDRAYLQARAFIQPEQRNRLQPKQGSEVALTVVRLREPDPLVQTNTDGTFSVELAVQQVGLLRADGTLAPPVSTETEYKFNLSADSENGNGGLYVTDPPNVLLLSDTALERYYERHLVYFWSTDQTRLVPDQRYLPLTVPKERLVNEVVRWLIGGPSEWLASGVSRLPDRTDLINNATGADSRWEVNLRMPGEDVGKLNRLATQLAWSLADLGQPGGQLDLKIGNQSRRIIDLARERAAHPVYSLLPPAAQRFCVYDGAIHPLNFPEEPPGQVPVVAAENHDIVSAGLSRAEEEILAALVVTGPDRKLRLRVGTGVRPVAVFNTGDDRYAAMGRPVWLRPLHKEPPHGLVVADNRLYSFDQSAGMTPVALTVPGPVTAVAAALDGRRIAVIVGGRLHVAAVNLDGGVVNVGPARTLATSLTGLTAVDWGGENSLIASGLSAGPAGRRPALHEVGVDGALETSLKPDVGAQVTHLAAYPTNPVVPQPANALMYEANGVSWANSPFETIKRDQVLDVAQPPAGGRPSNPTAPFFLY
ncbi:LpqB family beta-propeller domain-containing protein [Micromonospora siamensis]|uniref:Lipoprotein LpqB beta-propeller domain-containing protein n=1 Tax=Micromonospora siamensis TaxID=299152 RepID=A0A1C5HFU2_9ACTN|nr:LpqB family beta-propeller domain-containing protein [Micromonospora siamensis]SCG44929.1 Lipoprotein LpqB beta-propeller domain-containing protein [Micromonospora siamensis]